MNVSNVDYVEFEHIPKQLVQIYLESLIASLQEQSTEGA
jgi:hypothetical protein